MFEPPSDKKFSQTSAENLHKFLISLRDFWTSLVWVKPNTIRTIPAYERTSICTLRPLGSSPKILAKFSTKRMKKSRTF